MDADNDVRRDVAQCIAAVLGLDEDAVLDANRFERIDGWDSLRHLQMMSEVERAFACSFSVDEIVSVGAVDDVVALIRQKAG